MGKNKKENFVFTLICCALMVIGMTAYNVILRNGLSSSFLKDVLIGFGPIFCIALIIDWFFIGKVSKGLVSKLVNENTPKIKKIMLISFFMVSGMCFCMSLITLMIHQGLSREFPSMFIGALLKNYIVALPLQFIIVGPIARTVFFKMYPAI